MFSHSTKNSSIAFEVTVVLVFNVVLMVPLYKHILIIVYLKYRYKKPEFSITKTNF